MTTNDAYVMRDDNNPQNFFGFDKNIVYFLYNCKKSKNFT
jgi:hypothetical protein